MNKMILLARTAVLLSALAAASAANAKVCAKDHHAITFDGNTADLQDYKCILGSLNGTAGLRVSFYRVSELVAGSLVMGTPFPVVDEIFGSTPFVNNDIYQQTRAFFTDYGESLTYETPEAIDWTISIAGQSEITAPENPSPSSPPTATSTKPIRIRYLSRLFDSISSDGVLLNAPSKEILESDHWPSGYSMYYDCPEDERKFITCTTIWKYIALSDFDPILADIKMAYQRAEKSLREKEKSPDDVSKNQAKFVRTGISDLERNFNFFHHLGNQQLPSDFLFIASNGSVQDSCDIVAQWTFLLAARRLAMDFAIIENISEQPIRIDDFIGAKSARQDFRSTADAVISDTTPSTSLGLAPIVLQPKAKVAIATRILFTEDQLPSAQSDVPATETYQRIKPKASYTEIIGGFNSRKSVTKLGASFAPPSVPTIADYVYGPEINFSGLNANGTSFTFEQNPDNVVKAQSSGSDPSTLDLSIGKIIIKPAPPGGSCPVLYSWDEDAQSWIYQGKVLHFANGADHAMTDRIEFPLLRTRFRIAEQEPEASFIDALSLTLTLRDGHHVQLPPRQPIARMLSANTAIDVDFDLPSGIARDEVVKSELNLTGFYRRYSDVLAADIDVDAGTK